ncbi:1-phosphatidylinositol-3-phosphate 5-kinase FAB1B-like isoform X2 [Salvia miltiorrhiza]|uniref:1-phosphatidylinositol-3-phosphate 5-kinase FAB1B-like isoform X2 n=1 Tax=Salvia miltiorrhiza TaxID=226208 RepID=UPI0025ABF9D1|nr:1-phosphatidylinositol-3-phosphate 5-kinase FAB1B-like isoform X2 [Salvia miltiorrhiza]
MDSPNRTFPDIVGLVKSWIPWRSEPAHVSRDFWMPDESCRVCYECDTQFTLFNRRHHCRLCGRIFCSKCTLNCIPTLSSEPKLPPEDWDKIRVCNYCFKLWEQGLTAPVENGNQVAELEHSSSSPSATSFISTMSSNCDSSSMTFVSLPKSVGRSPSIAGASIERQSTAAAMNNDRDVGIGEQNLSQDQLNCLPCSNYDSCKAHPDGDTVNSRSMENYPTQSSFNFQASEEAQQVLGKTIENDISDECEAPSSLYVAEDVDLEPVDFENNGVLWLPPEPEDEEDEREALLFEDDDDDDDAAASGEWGYSSNSNSFQSEENREKDKTNEEQKKVMKSVVDGHFRALVAQLLQVENIPSGDENDEESWLEIITSLSWEAATLLKPDMSKSGQMDPGGYVKVKCLASGCRSESMVVKGVVCKKNVAHRRMTSKIEKPRMLILGGALEYHRVSNALSSFDTLLQQEMDHLKMAVAKIEAHHPNILLVEKSVSRYAQEYLLAKNISLVLNIKKPLLERIARCTGSQIVPSIDHLTSPKLGYCDRFHVEKFVEEHGSSCQAGKKLVKTLMYFEGCPKPLGFTILLRGANGDDLKKVKHVVQYGIFAAYHLALETSFLADEGASLPELPVNAPITVALPDKPSKIDRSISTIPGFTVPENEKTPGPQTVDEPLRSVSVPSSELIKLSTPSTPVNEYAKTPDLSAIMSSHYTDPPSFSTEGFQHSLNDHSPWHGSEETGFEEFFWSPEANILDAERLTATGDCHISSDFGDSDVKILQGDLFNNDHNHNRSVSLPPSFEVNGEQILEEQPTLNEDFQPTPSDHQSILVSLSSRCVWKGTVCERSHLFRIKYYGNFDKPLGRFLRDHLFDQNYSCRSCEMPAEAHVQCYTHRQGTLTISVKKLAEILLPGEKDGKIWMWHRCLKCPRANGFPPATRRVVMSDAAWGLSFGKFLELSFSNHAAASRVASCGHSLHRDCLRFYGFGNMVACFRYASIDVHSVYLPPSKLEFNYESQEWIQREVNEVASQAELLFSEVLNALRHLVEGKSCSSMLSNGINVPQSAHHLADLEVTLHEEKIEFEGYLRNIVNKEPKKGQLAIDILEINRLRRQLVFQCYVWDHRLIYADSLDNKTLQDDVEVRNPETVQKHAVNENLLEVAVPVKTGKAIGGSGSVSANSKTAKVRHRHGLSDQQGNHHVLALHQRTTSFFVSDFAGTKTRDESNIVQSDRCLRRSLSDGQVPFSLTESLDAAWTGENNLGFGITKNNNLSDDDKSPTAELSEKLDQENHGEDLPSTEFSKNSNNTEETVSWLGMPFMSFYRSLIPGSSHKLDTLSDYAPVYISSYLGSELQSGARLLLPVGVNDIVVPLYDDEPTSIISYVLLSDDYAHQLSNEAERQRDGVDSLLPTQSLDSLNLPQSHSFHEMMLESSKSFGPSDETFLSLTTSRSSLPFPLDPLLHTKASHARVSFEVDGPLGQVKYTVTCYFAKRFDALRRMCCPSEVDFIRSLSRCKKWGAQGGKSNVFFAKTLDDRFIIKQVTKTELESFIKFAPGYFKYLSESIASGSPTCLAKILGIYQVGSRLEKGGKESKMDFLVMENLLFGRNLSRLYDLKGSSRSRYNPDTSGSNKVLLDQNLIEAMPTSPIFVGNKAKRILERAVWNDTAFLASVDVMDYSLLVGVDEEKNELVLGIIDFMRQYTWDKHLETWVKASGILGGPKNASPTVISPKQYKRRFRKAMTTYFLMVPDQWSPPASVPAKPHTDLSEDNHSQTTTPAG